MRILLVGMLVLCSCSSQKVKPSLQPAPMVIRIRHSFIRKAVDDAEAKYLLATRKMSYGADHELLVSYIHLHAVLESLSWLEGSSRWKVSVENARKTLHRIRPYLMLRCGFYIRMFSGEYPVIPNMQKGNSW